MDAGQAQMAASQFNLLKSAFAIFFFLLHTFMMILGMVCGSGFTRLWLFHAAAAAAAAADADDDDDDDADGPAT